MKKYFKTFCLLLIIVIGFCLSGCHGKQKNNEFVMPESFDTSRNYELTFWAKNDTNITQKKIYQQAIIDFQKLYPNITIILKSYNDYNMIYNDAITNIRTNTTPNVCISYPDHVATYMTGDNVMVSLDSLMNDSKYGLGGTQLRFDSVSKSEIVNSFLEECIIEDNYYLLPFMRSSEAVYINKDYVESLGYTIPEVLTWDFVWEVSEAAMIEKNTKSSNSLIPFIYKSTDNMMIQMLKQKKAGYSNNDGEVLIFNDVTKQLLKDIASHCDSRCFSTFKISSYPGNTFNKGKCLFAIDSTAGATWMGSNAPLSDIHDTEVEHFTTVVKPIPQFDTSDIQMISQGPSLCLFNKDDPQEVLASWMFMQYLITNKVQIAYSKTEGYVPVTYKAQNADEYRDYLSKAGENNQEYYNVKIDATKILLNNLDKTFVTPVFNGSASLRNAAGQMIEEVVKTKNKNKIVDDQYIEQLYENMTSLYLKTENQNFNDLGKMPMASIILIVSIGVIWVLIATYYCIVLVKKKKKM